MRRNFGAKPMLYPMPVLILGTWGDGEKANAMNAAWGGISEEDEITVCISATHKTTENLMKRGAFTVSVADRENVVAADYVGIESGHKTDKIARAGWTAIPSSFVDAPIFDELPMTLECRVKSYDPETCRLVGEIVNVSADDGILDEEGKITLEKFHPITYDPVSHTYREIGAVCGKAFSDGLKLK